jgi:hypothetical protein
MSEWKLAQRRWSFAQRRCVFGIMPSAIFGSGSPMQGLAKVPERQRARFDFLATHTAARYVIPLDDIGKHSYFQWTRAIEIPEWRIQATMPDIVYIKFNKRPRCCRVVVGDGGEADLAICVAWASQKGNNSAVCTLANRNALLTNSMGMMNPLQIGVGRQEV